MKEGYGMKDRKRVPLHVVYALMNSRQRRVALSLVAAAAGGYVVYQAASGNSLIRSNASRLAVQKTKSDKGQKRDEKVEKGAKAPNGNGGRARRKPTRGALKKLLPLLLKVAGRKIIVIFFFSILKTALSNRMARLQGYLFRAAFLRRVPLFARNLVENVALCAASSALEATTRSWVSFMELQWRRLLTKRLHQAYFNDMMYYKLNYVDRNIDSPEQRICEDIPKLTSGLADLTREIISAAVDATFYAWQLQRYSGTNKYTAAVIGYVLGAGTFMTVAAPNFGKLFKKQQSLEGSYRQLHTRLRANAEPIAFYNGMQKEGILIRTKFEELMAFTQKLLSKQWEFSMVQDFLLKYLGATVAVALIIGPFFGGHLRPEATVLGRAQMLSNMRYHTSVIISLFAALGTLGSSSRKFLRLGAYADRVKEMEDNMRTISEGRMTGTMGDVTGEMLNSDDSIIFEGATVVTPGNATLVEDLNLRVPTGTNLLVTGPNGAGKSSLFRVLGGLWPLTKGKIRKPGGGASDEGGLSHEIFYVPQRPYVTVGTLQDQLLYPLESTVENQIPRDELRSLLSSVDLESLLDRAGGGEEVTNWSEVLSLGEQQRLGMARLFFHRPRFAILDECTSGVTVEMEERFCEMVRDMGCTCITISHRPALMAFHDVVLHLDGEGGWAIHPGHRSLGRDTDIRSADDSIEQESNDNINSDANVESSKELSDSIDYSEKKNEMSTRKVDTEAVLRGMMSNRNTGHSSKSNGKKSKKKKKKSQREEMLGDGNEGYAESVLASAPSSIGNPTAALWSPGLSLKPSMKSPLSRWNTIVKVLIGANPQKSAVQLSTVTGVIVLRTLLQDRIASLNGRSVDLVLRQDIKGFLRLIGVSILQSGASAILAPSLKYVADNLAVSWRTRLTGSALSKYLSGKISYVVAELADMSDIDQRLTRDIDRLSNDLAALIPTLVKPIVDVGWFSLQLWKLCGLRGMIVLYLYTIVGYGALKCVTPDFAGLLRHEYGLEGAFRNAHSRLRAHAESIAFFGGGPREGRLVSESFDALTKHLHALINLRWAYGSADEFFAKQLPHSVTWILTLLYAKDQKGNFADTLVQGALVHDMRYLASVVTQCFTAFGELLALPKRFSEISGGVNRVSEALEVIHKAEILENEIKLKLNTDGSPEANLLRNKEDSLISAIEFKGVDVITPGGVTLARQLSVKITPETSFLISGPNGSGKTSLVRLLAGLWPLPDGQLYRPSSDTIYYVPQKPYTTPGSLREQIIYPLSTARARQRYGDAEDPPAALDEALNELMSKVKLDYLVDREGGLDAVKEWGDVLSLGEQQRVGMARLFFHKPKFGILDEATNATSVDVEEALYEYATKSGITLVTITQRTALVKFHKMELRLVGEGKGDWQLRDIHEVK